MRKKGIVFVGMSGGVDSSVAALLLKRQGYDVVGVFMRCYNIDGCAERDAEDARRTAEHIGIPFYVWDFEKEYKAKVVRYMVEGYRRGQTPNPDVECNREIKFGLFFRRARKLGADFVSTGHYVRLVATPTREAVGAPTGSVGAGHYVRKFAIGNSRLANYELRIAKDKNKDQSYFLWTLTGEQLAHCLFPIGAYTKSAVRAIARRAGLPTAEKKDSQGICFLGNISVSDFLKRYIKPKRGTIVTTEGVPVGRHEGAYFYTIGQRKGLDLKEKNTALGISGAHVTAPHYVAAKDAKKNVLVVAEGSRHPALYRNEVVLRDVQFLRPAAYSQVLKNLRIEVMARVRYRQPLAKAELRVVRNGSRGKKPRSHGSLRMTLNFHTPQKFIAPGQSAVFYAKTGAMLGGGIIV